MLEALLVAGAISSPTSPTKELLETKPITETVQVVERPRLYTIQPGDNLTKIANAHTTTVERLWSANPELTNPDRIEPSQSLKIPDNDEVLPEREMPVTVENTTNESSYADKARSNAPSGRSSVSHKTGKQTPGWYYAGQCTAWVANKRFVPDGWGNASDWKWHAQAEGWTVSSTPVAGAIGWTSGHVVYVESIGDGVVTISEANYDWNGSVRTITVPISKYVYLY